MNEKKIVLVAIIIAALIMMAGYFYFDWQENSRETSNNQNIKLPSRCLSDSDCPDDYSCYNSRQCKKNAQGITACGNQTGDLLCHKNCSAKTDCLETQQCQSVAIWSLDVSIPKKLCI